MDVVVGVTGVRDEDHLPALLDWLRHEDAFRGRVRMRTTRPAPDELGAVTDALMVAISGGGAITALVSSIAVWLRHRRSDVTIEIDVGDRKLALSAERIKADPDSVTALIKAARAAVVEEEQDEAG